MKDELGLALRPVSLIHSDDAQTLPPTFTGAGGETKPKGLSGLRAGLSGPFHTFNSDDGTPSANQSSLTLTFHARSHPFARVETGRSQCGLPVPPRSLPGNERKHSAPKPSRFLPSEVRPHQASGPKLTPNIWKKGSGLGRDVSRNKTPNFPIRIQ